MSNNKTIKELTNSRYILDQIKGCIDEHISTFDAFTSTTKGGKPGTHQQNLLRGTILLSCAGLDSFLKQLVKDCLVKIKSKNEKSERYFQKVIEKQILYKEDNSKNTDKNRKNQPFKDGATFIAESLLSGDPRKFVEKYVVDRLLADSKQSFGSLQEMSNAFGVDVPILRVKGKEIQELFKMRNEISHEFDIRFHNTQGKRNRIERSREVVSANANLVYEIAKSFFETIEKEMV